MHISNPSDQRDEASLQLAEQAIDKVLEERRRLKPEEGPVGALRDGFTGLLAKAILRLAQERD